MGSALALTRAPLYPESIRPWPYFFPSALKWHILTEAFPGPSKHFSCIPVASLPFYFFPSFTLIKYFLIYFISDSPN